MKTKENLAGKSGKTCKERRNTKILFYDYIKIKGVRQTDALDWREVMNWRFADNQCRTAGDCYFRGSRNQCRLLTDTRWEDGRCRFRKLELTGENLYDSGTKTLVDTSRIGLCVKLLYEDGLSTYEIAKAIGVEEIYVKMHLRNIS